MALLFNDGFDHYGAVGFGGARLREGVYAETNLGAGGGVLNTNPRTGPRHLRFNGGENDAGVRRVLTGGAESVVGGLFAVYLSALPTNNNSLGLWQWRDVANDIQASVWVASTGQLIFRQGGRNGTIMGMSDLPVLYPQAYQSFEAARNGSTGAAEVRVDNVNAVSVTGLGTGSTGQVKIGASGYPLSGAVNLMVDIDDLNCWSGTGDFNNDFMGDRRVYTGFMPADGPLQDWTPSIGSDGYAMIDNVPPLDVTEYLTAPAGASGVIRSLFRGATFPDEIVSISGIMLATRAWKTDAGPASIQTGVISDSVIAQQPERPVATAPRWVHDVYEVDPATAAPFTLEALNAIDTVLDRPPDA